MIFDFSHRNTFGDDATESCAAVILRAFRQRGYHAEQLGKIFRITKGDDVCFIHASDTTFTSTIASKVWKNKALTKRLLREAGVSVPQGRTFQATDMRRAQRFAERLGSCVVKPVDGIRGKGVSVDVPAADFADAWADARNATSGRIVVERFFQGGREARYLVIDNKCAAVNFRFAPVVHGDGKSTVTELVDRQNAIKVQHNPSRVDSLLYLDTHRINLLSAKGLSPASVLPAGQDLVLDEKTNISTGGECYEFGTAVHESYLRIAERAARTVPGSHVLGIDLIAHDHSQPATADNYAILEANTAPGLDIHIFPDFGTPNDVAMTIVESCIEKMAASNEMGQPNLQPMAVSSAG